MVAGEGYDEQIPASRAPLWNGRRILSRDTKCRAWVPGLLTAGTSPANGLSSYNTPTLCRSGKAAGLWMIDLHRMPWWARFAALSA